MATALWRICRRHDGMRPPKFHPIGPLIGNLWRFQNFVYGGRPLSWIWILLFWTTHEVNYAVRLPGQNLVSIRSFQPKILRFYNFAILAGKYLTTPLIEVWAPLKSWVVNRITKRHILVSFKPQFDIRVHIMLTFSFLILWTWNVSCGYNGGPIESRITV